MSAKMGIMYKTRPLNPSCVDGGVMNRGKALRWIVVCLALMTAGVTARADNVKPDDVDRMFHDTLIQLKDAQNRKAELATENDKLTARVAELQKQLAAQSVQLDDARRQASALADRTLFLRSHYAAWEQFISAYPAVKTQWELFVRTVAWASAPSPGIFMDPEWPISLQR
jgi:septal ring factor EnvC (AmiA/AmiB activator)